MTGITDSNGNLQFSYYYDAWGTPYYIYASGNTCGSTLLTINPIMYRGYVFDRELGMYYLQSRYYIPQIGRFLNADDAELLFEDQETILQYNVYAYCWNNPSNLYDPDGYWGNPLLYMAFNALTPTGWAILGTVVIVAVVVSIHYYSEHVSTKNGKKRNKHEKGNARRQRDQGGEKKKQKKDGKREDRRNNK